MTSAFISKSLILTLPSVPIIWVCFGLTERQDATRARRHENASAVLAKDNYGDGLQNELEIIKERAILDILKV